MDINKEIANELNIKVWQVCAVKDLLKDGATVPFISRYRKEATGELDEVLVLSVKESLEKYSELEKRKDSILKSLKDNGFITDILVKKVTEARTLPELEDIYLPYKPKRKTRGSKAREKGLEPLALKILKGEECNFSDYINKDVTSKDEAVSGAKDIIAEIINEDSNTRSSLRRLFVNEGVLKSKVVKAKKDEAEKYKDYFDYSEKIKKIPSHRLLAVLRGANEGLLRFSIEPDKDNSHTIMKKKFSKGFYRDIITEAIEDSYKRLLKPSLETDMKNSFKIKADDKAIDVFKANLKELLLAAPLGQKIVMAIDPGLRTGSKVVCLNRQGDLMEYSVIKPLPPHNKTEEAVAVIKKMCKKHRVEAVAVGNGTGGREMEKFCRDLNLEIPVILTNESGASIYSASKCAREEFPDLDLTIRGAVSIGRRLMDPLAELVKIDPKSIGVGQYQHDVDQKMLMESLDNVVESCVNSVGVELNTSSKELLSYVAGLNKKSALNIINYREEIGGFTSRSQLLKVKGVGQKAYEQAAGFLRVRESKMPLDKSGVHPERYKLVEKIASDNKVSITDLMSNDKLRKSIDIKKYISGDVGEPTLKDIFTELSKPGRDPRDKFELFEFSSDVNSVEDLSDGMVLPGIVTNVTAFGAFVDIGVHQDGLVHISQLADRYVSNPSDIVKNGDKVNVKVLDVDVKRKRISLSMKDGV